MCVQVQVEGKQQPQLSLLSDILLVLWHGTSHLPGAHQIGEAVWPMLSLGIYLSVPPQPWDYGHVPPSMALFMWFLGIEHYSLCLKENALLAESSL